MVYMGAGRDPDPQPQHNIVMMTSLVQRTGPFFSRELEETIEGQRSVEDWFRPKYCMALRYYVTWGCIEFRSFGLGTGRGLQQDSLPLPRKALILQNQGRPSVDKAC